MHSRSGQVHDDLWGAYGRPTTSLFPVKRQSVMLAVLRAIYNAPPDCDHTINDALAEIFHEAAGVYASDCQAR